MLTSVHQLRLRTSRYDVEFILFRCEQLCVHLNRLTFLEEYTDLLPILHLLLQAIWLVKDDLYSDRYQNLPFHAPIESDQTRGTTRGRPRFAVSREQLSKLLELGFSASAISAMFSVSVRTIRRRLTEYNLSVSAIYTDISDDELDSVIQSLIHEFPSSGYRMMDGYLRGRGLRIQQGRLRSAMQRCDPHGVVLRWLGQIHPRASYSVYGPQALWHIDGNHKLVRYLNNHFLNGEVGVFIFKNKIQMCIFFIGGDLLFMPVLMDFQGYLCIFVALTTTSLSLC